jgi:hypothetical protein
MSGAYKPRNCCFNPNAEVWTRSRRRPSFSMSRRFFFSETSPIVPQSFCSAFDRETSGFSRTKDDDEDENESSISELLFQ